MNYALADFRVTDYAQIERWWEIVMSTYLMVSLHAQVFNNPDDKNLNQPSDPIVEKFREHEWWDRGQGWKNLLNNLRLVIQPLSFFNLIKPWLKVFPNLHLSIGFSTLVAFMNQMQGAIPDTSNFVAFLFYSA
jgi:hypothetical protein